jgi:hypothetical protein
MRTRTSRSLRRFIMPTTASAARISGAVVLCVIAAGCEQTVAPVTAIVLRNETLDSIGYRAVELRASALLSLPSQAISDSNFRGSTLAPGGEQIVNPATIEAYSPGADLRFYLFRIRAGRALISGEITYTNAQLQATNGVIAISSSAFFSKVTNQDASQGCAALFAPLDDTAGWAFRDVNRTVIAEALGPRGRAKRS